MNNQSFLRKLTVCLKNLPRKLVAALKEFSRRTVASLKRSPQTIPLVALFVTFLLFSLNLTEFSNTTAKIQGTNMGLAQFAVMLLSMLSLVTMLNGFPRRKKPNIPMVVLMFLMFAVMIFCDIHYRNAIFAAVRRPENPIIIDASTQYIANAYNLMQWHMVCLGVTAALVVTLPVYSKLIRKIDTSVVLEDNGEMAAIEIGD